jgi:hypothetical protein
MLSKAYDLGGRSRDPDAFAGLALGAPNNDWCFG